MNTYLALRHLHIASVVISIALFVFRGGLMFAGSRWLQNRFLRIAPHVVDTVLLGTAVALVIMSSQYPFQQAWLTAKVLALVAYILLGTVAIKRGPTLRVRGLAFFAALATVLWIVSVARSRDPYGFLAPLIG